MTRYVDMQVISAIMTTGYFNWDMAIFFGGLAGLGSLLKGRGLSEAGAMVFFGGIFGLSIYGIFNDVVPPGLIGLVISGFVLFDEFGGGRDGRIAKRARELSQDDGD